MRHFPYNIIDFFSYDETEYISEEDQQKEISETIIKCLGKNDIKTFNSLFSDYTELQKAFDKQVKAVMDFFEGNIISHDVFKVGGGGKYWDDGALTRHSSSTRINNIKTDAGKVYSFLYSNYLVSAVEPKKKGICEFTIVSGDDYFQDCESAEKRVVGEWVNARAYWDEVEEPEGSPSS